MSLMSRLRQAFARPPETKRSATGPLIAIHGAHQPVWMSRDAQSFAREGYAGNAVGYRCVRMIAEAAATVPWLAYDGAAEAPDHEALALIERPNPAMTGRDWREAFFGHLLVSGNAYAEAVLIDGRPRELHVLRPDRMRIVPGSSGWPEAFDYTVNGVTHRFQQNGPSAPDPILHVKLFDPLGDHYGLSPFAAAARAVDIHNAASAWTKALLDNAARPSGALIYRGGADGGGNLTEEQFTRLRQELETTFQGAANAGPGRSMSENAHASAVRSDWSVSLDQLQATCPQIGSASLVVAWFGDSLEAGRCTLKPGVDAPDKDTRPGTWSVAGLARADARQVSRIDGRAAFGGTPSDAGVIRALSDLKARGLKALFYPFILMDLPGYPWRGRITAAAGADATPAAAAELQRFFGTAKPSDFQVTAAGVSYSGPQEWSLRRMVLHYAALCAAAGGVDAFLIASELKGITRLRDRPGNYPAAAMLAALARDVKLLLPDAKLSYAADWSEYGAHRPDGAAGDLGFPLDPLWAEPAIAAVAIDYYMPLSDWRDGTAHRDAAAGWSAIHDRAYLSANVTGGEYFDWYYASEADRAAQTRTPISDALGKPWVWRTKDLAGWWSKPHLPRSNGAEGAATAWVPQSKPIWFTEAGCPAVDKGSNEPNRFPDAKSADAGLPYGSNGRRDDLIQRRYLEALIAAYADPARNPRSAVYGGPMVDMARIYLWCWDARPYPWFPALADVWSDGVNYPRGHWLNGRLGTPGLDDLISAILARYGITVADVSGAGGTLLPGYVIDHPMSARDALEPLITAFAILAAERGAVLRFTAASAASAAAQAAVTLVADDCVDRGAGKPLSEIRRADAAGLPVALRIGFADIARGHRASAVEVRLPEAGAGGQEITAALAAVMSEEQARGLAAAGLAAARLRRETLSFTRPPSSLALEPGDIIALPETAARPRQLYRITALRGGLAREVEAEACAPELWSNAASAGDGRALAAAAQVPPAPPLALLLDLPLLPGARGGTGPFIAAAADPWPGSLALYRRTGPAAFSRDGSITVPAIIGVTLNDLAAGPIARRDRAARLTVEISGGQLQSVSDSELLNGANLAAIGSMGDGFELIQFQTAALIGERRWQLSGLLRGLSGSASEMTALRKAGANFVLLDGSAVMPDSAAALSGRWQAEWRIGPAARDIGDASYVTLGAQSQARAARPLAPCQLRVSRSAAGLALSWIRQTRTGGDSWDQLEVPLGETAEAYQLTILKDGAVLRSLTLASPRHLYAIADLLADCGGSLPQRFTFRIAQLAPEYGPGAVLEETRNV